MVPLDEPSARVMAEAMANIDPWATLRISPQRLLATLLARDANSCVRLIRVDEAIAGVVGVRTPWLYGPYLMLLAILPQSQRCGLGSAVLEWMARETPQRPANLWTCASAFNTRALAFYRSHGFAPVGELPDLVAPGFAEVLLRKPLPGS